MVTILTACIPTLRPLYKAVFHRASTGDEAEYNTGSKPSRSRFQKHFKLSDLNTDSASQKSSLKLGPYGNYAKTDVVAGHLDDESDKSILEHGERSGEGIRRDKTVTVVYDA